MYGAWVVGLLITLSVIISNIAEKEVEHLNKEVRILADYMVFYHKATMKACNNTTICTSSGQVNHSTVMTYMSPLATNALYGAGKIRSYTNGTLVITIYDPALRGESFNQGNLAATLVWLTGSEKKSGAYDRSTGQIGSYVGLGAITVPNNVGGYNVPDGSAIIASGF